MSPEVTGPRPVWRALAAAAALVALADAVQPLIFDWRPKLYGAIGGAVLYGTIAAGAWSGRRWAAVGAAIVPVLPVGILLATAAGLDLPVAPDAAMVGVLTIQLVAAALGLVALSPGGSTARPTG